MDMSTNNYRPGVYSQYDVSSFYTTTSAIRHGAVAAKANGGEEDRLYCFTGYAAACQVFGPDNEGSHMRGCLKILFESGVSQVYAVAVRSDYQQALALLEEVDNIGAVICDCTQGAELEALRASVEKSSGALRERIAFCGIEGPDDAIAAANALSSERICLCCPGAAPRELSGKSAVYCAAAVAGAVLAANDPAHNFSGEILRAVEEPDKLAEAVIQSLLAAGVTVVEQVGSSVQLVRALTTRTAVGGVEDRSMSGLNTILIIDDVIISVREALQLRLRGGRISTQSLESVVSQVTVELAAKQDAGIIESFLAPKVYTDGSDPSVCVVELSFKVAHVLSQIHVVAHIQV